MNLGPVKAVPVYVLCSIVKLNIGLLPELEECAVSEGW
jgi:hypothetical protein